MQKAKEDEEKALRLAKEKEARKAKKREELGDDYRSSEDSEEKVKPPVEEV